MGSKSLSFRLITGGILLLVVPFLVLGIFAVWKSSSALEKVAMNQSTEIAKSLANMAQLAIQEELKIVSQLATRESVIEAAVKHKSGVDDTEKLVSELSTLVKNSNNEYETVFVAGLDGIIFADGVNGKYKNVNVSDRDYIKTAIAGKLNIGTVVKSKVSNTPVLVFGAPVYSKSNELVGILGSAVKIGFLTDKVADIKFGQTGYAWIIDHRGVVISHPKKEFILEMNLAQQEGLKETAAKMLVWETGHDVYYFQGVKKVSGYAPVELAKWSIAVTQNHDELMAPASQIRNFILIWGLVFLALTIAVVLYFAKSISNPIGRAVLKMNEASDQFSITSSQINSTSQSLSEGASETAAAIEETSSSLEEMSSMTKQNAENATAAKALMSEAKHIVEKVDGHMKNMADAIQDVTKSSEETSKIIKTIDEIAFQTNLLALNAAVEAARAGEAGAGFAVVADEVRNLAIRAAEAAKNTSDLIENTIKSVKYGNDITTATRSAFKENMEIARKIGDLVDEIAAASDEQARGIEQINKAIAEMDKVTQQNASDAEESASAAKAMNGQSLQIRSVVVDLSKTIFGTGKNDFKSRKEFEDHKDENKSESANIISLPSTRGRVVNPDDVIPMKDGDFIELSTS